MDFRVRGDLGFRIYTRKAVAPRGLEVYLRFGLVVSDATLAIVFKFLISIGQNFRTLSIGGFRVVKENNQVGHLNTTT